MTKVGHHFFFPLVMSFSQRTTSEKELPVRLPFKKLLHDSPGPSFTPFLHFASDQWNLTPYPNLSAPVLLYGPYMPPS